jgi:class 3 adenylate cyclase
VSVLFSDLVGFTALSESRDAEEVRELLSRYFETSRRLVERYAGTLVVARCSTRLRSSISRAA